jgi:hypothetical protein
MPREAAAKLLAGVSADRVADIFRVLTLFIPLIVSSEGDSGSQALFNRGTSPRASYWLGDQSTRPCHDAKENTNIYRPNDNATP